MACLVCMCPTTPPEGYKPRGNDWQVPLAESCGADLGQCCFGFWCAECTACLVRKRALQARQQWPQGYSCCQKQLGPCCCFKPGEMGEANNAECCLCLEAFFFTGCSMSSTYIDMMNYYNLNNDPNYNQFVHCNNCLVAAGIICTVAGAFFRPLRSGAQCLRCISNLVFRTLMGGLNVQLNHELDHQMSLNPPAGTNVAVGVPIAPSAATQKGYATLPPPSPTTEQGAAVPPEKPAPVME